jgi:hypothetical protein
MADTSENKTDWKEREIGALWKQAGRNQNYLSGHITDKNGEQQRVVVFGNKHKDKNERAPDYRVYKSEPMAQRETDETTESSSSPDLAESDELI